MKVAIFTPVLAAVLISASGGFDPAAADPPQPGKCITTTKTQTTRQGLKRVCTITRCYGSAPTFNCRVVGLPPPNLPTGTRVRGPGLRFGGGTPSTSGSSSITSQKR